MKSKHLLGAGVARVETRDWLMSPKNCVPNVGIFGLALALLLISAPRAIAQVQIFKAPQAFPAGPNPVAEATGDFNTDGKMDLVVANNSSGTVSVMLGNGDGTFQPPKNFPVGNGPAAVMVGDFNGDGKLDLAVANSTDGTVSILLGNGDGTFQAAVNYAGTVGATWMTAGDFNGDGKLDLAITGTINGGSLVALLGNGDGTFRPAAYYSTRLGGWGAPDAFGAVGDFNGDGKIDVVLGANFGKQVCTPEGCRFEFTYLLELFLGNGNGTFQNYIGYPNPAGFSGLATGDFNADGKVDIAACAFGGVEVFLGNGDGTFQPPTAYGGGAGPLAVADLNGDGKLDIAVSSTFNAGGVSVLLGNGDGTFQPPISYAAGPFQSGIAIADFNGDGKADLALANNVANGAVTVLLGNGDGTFGPQAPEFQLGGGSSPFSLVAGDFNDDGTLDLVVLDLRGNPFFPYPALSVLLGNGDGTFQPADLIEITQGNPAGISTGDFNGDNKLDLALGNGGTGLMVMLGNGDGTFQPPVSYSTPYSVAYPSIAIGDFNGDNRPDLAMADGFGHVDILLGNGDGTFQGAVTYSSGQSCDPSSVAICMETPAIGDFNGDGKLDLAVPDVVANTVNVLLGNGDGTFQAPVTFPVGTQPTAVAVADFNHDSKLDLAVGNNASSTISILLGNGDGTFQPAVNYPVAAPPGGIVVGDFNGDGIIDVAEQGNGLASVLLGKGDGTFRPQLNFAFGAAQLGNGIVAGDFDGDYTTDLVLVGGLGGTTASVLFNIAGFYLYTTESGTGAGTVTSVPSGINCSSTCSASFAGGAKVTLTAAPNSASNFTGWSGACSGMGTCSVTMKAATSVTATFSLQDFSLSAASAKLTLQPGGQSTDVITIAGLNGSFTSAIQLTCAVSGPALLPTCGFSAASVTPGGNSVSSTLTITAPAIAAAMLNPATHRQLGRLLYALWLPFMFGIAVVGGSRRLRRGYWALCSVLLLLLVLQTACGGGNNSNHGGTKGPTNYTVTVTGASGAIQHTTQVAVTVQ